MNHRTFPGEPPVVVAHRGASSTQPESTIASNDPGMALATLAG